MCHIICMTTYQIIPAGDALGFNISIAGHDGTRQTMLGFTTKEEAEAWIKQDKRLTGDSDGHRADGIGAAGP